MIKDIVKNNWIIAFIAILIIAVFQALWLVNLYESEKKSFSTDVDHMIDQAVIDTSNECMKKFPSGNGLRYRSKSRMITFGVTGINNDVIEDYPDSLFIENYQYPDFISGERGFTMGVYDFVFSYMQSRELYINTLDSIFTANVKAKNWLFPILFKITDQESDTLIASTSNFVSGTLKKSLVSAPILLGGKNRHVLTGYYVYPFSLFFYKTKNIILITAASFIALVLCFIAYMQVIRIQKRTGEMREEFVFNMVHELKAPIAYVKMVEYLISQSPNCRFSDEERELFIRSKQKLDGLSNTVQKLLTASSDVAGITLNKEQFNVRKEIEVLIGQYRYQSSPTKKIDIEMIFERKDEEIIADKMHLMNAIGNLVDNAIKYSGTSVEIRIWCSGDETSLIIEVGDNGHGIASEDLPHIFDKYYRSNEIRMLKQTPGFGLGLSYIKQIVFAHGGEIAVKSKKWSGSIFTITIPQ